MNIDGFPCSNFAIGATLSRSGQLFGYLQTNSGRLGQHLTRQSGGELLIRRRNSGLRLEQIQHRGLAINARDCDEVRVERQWPFAKLQVADQMLSGMTVSVTACAPLAARDHGRVSALPVLLAKITVHNGSTETIDDCEVAFPTVSQLGEEWHIGWYVDGQEVAETLPPLAPGEDHSRWLVLAFYDPQWVTGPQYQHAQDIANDAAARAEELFSSTSAFAAELPRSGDPELDTALSWNATAAVSLTKMTANNEVVSMGYKELNQRDSFWTTFLHLLLWPELDRVMIEESIAAQRSDGKIPTCILPTIERDVDIDINAYFVLRVVRHLAVYPDQALATQWWPAVLAAINFLDSLDDENVGLPYQRTFWGDWKDVPGVSERSYSPHACLITIAARRQAAAMAQALNDTAAAQELNKKADQAQAWIDQPFAEGGLWNGRFYQQRWRDGRDDGILLQDQILAGLFGSMDADKLASIWQGLNAQSATPFGVSETTPWYPAAFGYEPGHYHNGGIWPWLSYADAWCRLAHGRREDGIVLLKQVAWADLEREGDFQPHEYIAADSGKNCGPPIQGWTASFIGAIHWGLRGGGMPQLPQSF